MAILTEEKQNKILEGWEKWRAWRDDGKPIVGVPRFFRPITEKIVDTMPVVKGTEDFYCSSCNREMGSIYLSLDLELKFECPDCKKTNEFKRTSNSEEKKKFKKYEKKIIEKIKKYEEKYGKINNYCYLYVTFRRYNTPDFPDVDNLLKCFFDIIKGVLLKDDRLILGVKANKFEVFNHEEQGVSFTLIPAYKLKVDTVVNIEGEDLKILNALREKYSKGDKMTNWEHSMQMITTEHGIFFDTSVGKLWSVERYGEEEKEFGYKPELGFDWDKNKENDNKTNNGTEGVIIFQRSYCWWINKWANKWAE